MTPNPALGELFTGMGYMVGGLVFWWAAGQKKLATKGIGRIAIWGVAAGVAGAKMSELVVEGWPFRVSAVAALDPDVGGRALFGGLVFGWIGVEVAKWRLGIRRSTGDLFALALPAGEAVGRIGCFFNGCCYGERCDLPWAIYQHGAWRHPAQIYSAVVAVTMFGCLLALRKHVRREGDLFFMYLLAFGSTRFILEFFRWRESIYFGLSPMQWVCIQLTLASSVVLFIRARRTQNLAVAS